MGVLAHMNKSMSRVALPTTAIQALPTTVNVTENKVHEHSLADIDIMHPLLLASPLEGRYSILWVNTKHYYSGDPKSDQSKTGNI